MCYEINNRTLYTNGDYGNNACLEGGGGEQGKKYESPVGLVASGAIESGRSQV